MPKVSQLPSRQRILEKARDLYLRDGLQGLSMRRVAQAVGLSATAIYRHYASKEDLLVHLMDEGFRLFGSYLHQALEEPTPEDRFLRCGDRYVDFALENPGYYTLIFVSPQLWPAPALPPEVQVRARATFQLLVDRVQECMQSGWLMKSGDAEQTARTIWALTHGMVSLYLAGKLSSDEATFRREFAQVHQRLIQGLRQ